MQYFISILVVILKIIFVSNNINFLLFYFAVVFLDTEYLPYGTRILCRIILYSDIYWVLFCMTCSMHNSERVNVIRLTYKYKIMLLFVQFYIAVCM